jgi:uncharacterized protein
MKKTILSAAVSLLVCCTPAWTQFGSTIPQISVAGSAEVKVVPDEVTLDVAVETRAETLEPARVENDRNIATAQSFLRNNNVADKDIQVDYINIEPNYNNGSGIPSVKPYTYTVQKNLEIRVKQTDNFQTILTGLLTNGVNVVNGINFHTSQLRKFRDQARSMAIRAAKEKAQALTAELGGKLGKPINISTYDNVDYYGNYWGMNHGFNMNGMNNAIQNTVSAGGDPDATDDGFAVGQISISTTVNVSFRLE